MTIQEVGKQFRISTDILKKYESQGLIQGRKTANGLVDYQDKDLAHLGLIETFLNSGFTPEEIKEYIRLMKNIGTDAQQINMLKKRRRALLNDIHKNQQLLDRLDFMIWEKKGK